MILENFKNFDPDKYTSDIVFAVNYLRNLEVEQEAGIFELEDNICLIIEEYSIKAQPLSESQFEVHNYTIDIQYPLVGYEKTYYVSHESLINPTKYDQKKDRKLYSSKAQYASNIITGKGTFGIYFPGDPHSPQKAILDKEQNIKKATIKIITENVL